tara:strand:- start:404 stop:1417 length:1014 start_codon:yes stop_codon:yes gene_type:complete
MANITHKEQINSFRRALLSSDPFDSQEEEEDEEDEVVEKIEETGEFSYFVPRRTEETTQDIPYYDRQLKNFRSALTTPDEIKLEKSVLNYDDRYPVNPKSIPPGDISYIKTLDDFIKNKTINQVAYDFFQEMGEEGKATDMAYYFRKEISIDDMIRRMNQSKKWSNKQKERYMLLKETFDNTSWSDSSFQQKFKSVRQYGWQAMSDPSMIAAMLLAPFTGGGSIAARTGATETGKFMIRQAVANTMRSGLTKKNVHSLARSFVSTPAKSTATFTGAFSGVMNRLNQEVEMQLDPEKKRCKLYRMGNTHRIGNCSWCRFSKRYRKNSSCNSTYKECHC